MDPRKRITLSRRREWRAHQEAQAMEWTKQLPTQDGYYWLRVSGTGDAAAVVVRVGGGRVAFCGDDSDDIDPVAVWEGEEWLGPITPAETVSTVYGTLPVGEGE